MKNLHIYMLALGLGSMAINAAEVKQSAEQKEKDAATVALATAIYNLDVKGVMSALERGASLTKLVRTFHFTPDKFFIDTNALYAYPCMAILVNQAQLTDPNYILNDGTTAKDAITAILAALVRYGLDINANAQYTGGMPGNNPPLFAVFNWLRDDTNYALTDPYFIKALLDNGANINQQTQIIYDHLHNRKVGGLTALMLAVSSGAPAIFKFLYERGADTTIKDANDRHIMDYIDRSEKRDEFLKIIRKDVHQAAQKGARTNPQAWAPSSSVVADYLVGELEPKSKEEDEEDEEEEE